VDLYEQKKFRVVLKTLIKLYRKVVLGEGLDIPGDYFQWKEQHLQSFGQGQIWSVKMLKGLTKTTPKRKKSERGYIQFEYFSIQHHFGIEFF